MRKTQNIVEHMGVSQSVLKLFTLKFKEREHRELFKDAIRFFTYSAYNNNVNQDAFLTHFDIFLSLISNNIDVTKLMSQLLVEVKQDEISFEYIKKIFKVLNALNTVESSHYQYIVILRMFIMDKNHHPINHNQKRILSRLTKNRHFLNVIVSATTEGKSISHKSSDKHTRSQTEITDLKFQAEMLLLLANLTLESKFGIMQTKRIMAYDQYKAKLSDNSMPFLLKRSYLRCIFQVSISIRIT